MYGNEEVGIYLKKSRVALGLSQLEVSQKIGVHNQFVSNIERGVAPIPLTRVKKFVKVLDLDKTALRQMLLNDYTSELDAYLK